MAGPLGRPRRTKGPSQGGKLDGQALQPITQGKASLLLGLHLPYSGKQVKSSVMKGPWPVRPQLPLSLARGGPVAYAGASVCNNVSVFSFGGFLKRKKNFHFDFTLRYQSLWVRAPPLSPGWSLGLFSSVSRWGCIPKGHHARFSPPLPTSSRAAPAGACPFLSTPVGLWIRKPCSQRAVLLKS